MTATRFSVYDESQYDLLWDHYDSSIRLAIIETLELLISVHHLAPYTKTIEGLIQSPSWHPFLIHAAESPLSTLNPLIAHCATTTPPPLAPTLILSEH